MTAFFEYPKTAWVGRVLPKAKIYEHSKARSKLKQLFIDQVDQISWQYKLAPETINLSATESVSEIQIFRINARSPYLNDLILRAIDTAIEFPIIFELSYGNQQKVVATCKQRSRTGNIKLLSNSYFKTDWEEEGHKRRPLPVSSDLGSLYGNLLQAIIPIDRMASEQLGLWIERAEKIKNKDDEAARIAKKIAIEKQLNKRVVLKKRKLEIEQEIEVLKAAKATRIC